jgi:hypothetical protein
MTRLGRLSTLAAVVSIGCAPIPRLSNPLPLAPLSLRAMQSRSYPTRDARGVLKALVDVLQDDGFVVRYANTRLGLLAAGKVLAGPTSSELLGVPGRVAGIAVGTRPVVERLEATANVRESATRVTVRLSLERKVTDPAGAVLSVAPVTDEKTYQEFFVTLDKGLFLEREGL